MIKFYVECYERYLVIYTKKKRKATAILEKAYNKWLKDCEDCCCEEYLLQHLDDAGIKYRENTESLFYYYKNGVEELYTMPEVRKLFKSAADTEQKKIGNTFETWLYEMKKHHILNPV